MSRTVLVTGASRGLGLEFVRQLRDRGDRVLAACRGGPSAAIDALGAEFLPLDAASEASIDALGRRLDGRPVDVLINNAGVSSEARTVAALTGAELARVFQVNAFAPILVARAVLPSLRAGRGRVVFSLSSQLASLANNTAGGSSYAYRASKAALNMLNLQLAHELRAEAGFCCVAVHPGWVKTDMGGPQAPMTPEQSVSSMLATLDRLTPEWSGRFVNHDGTPMPW